MVNELVWLGTMSIYGIKKIVTIACLMISMPQWVLSKIYSTNLCYNKTINKDFETMVKKKKKANKINKKLLAEIIAPIAVLIAGCTGIGIAVNLDKNSINVKIDYAQEPVITGDEGDLEEVPTIEEIDGGGKFQDNSDGITDPTLYYERGSIEQVDTSSPEAFKKSTIGRCIIADNYYGAQCVSLARAFWWDYAGYDVSTCGTGLAKGMMDCYEYNARDKFKVIWSVDEIQEGTWIVLDGQTTGHICMALGKVNQGYVSCLGENQGGVACDYGVGGSGTNIINLSVKKFIGGYIPLSYIAPDPEPIPEPLAPDTGRK
jgi:hypothetical protein